MNSGEDWRRVSKWQPCPICKKPDWCLVALDGSAAICARTEDGAIKRVGEAGWLHRLRDNGWQPTRVQSITLRPARETPDLGGLARQYEAGLSERSLARLAKQLGVSVESLQRLGTGWDGKSWTFPMQNASGRIIGIRRRFPDGRKLAVKGGREGLFIPTGLHTSGRLLICEGPTDTAAILDLGFTVIGRPNAIGGKKQILAFVHKHHSNKVVIVADVDEAGQRGANELATALRSCCSSVRIITPPEGIKDARAWKGAGLTADELEQAIEAVPLHRLAFVMQGSGVDE